MPKSPSVKRLACVPCTRSKRKCTKEAPSCVRCLEKNITCHYPAPRVAPPYNLVYSKDGEISAFVAAQQDDNVKNVIPEFDLPVPRLDANSSAWPQPTVPSVSSENPFDMVDNPWFLTPASWSIDHKDAVLVQMYFSDESLTYFTNQLRTWLEQWNKEGSCPLIHSHLYDVEIPPCVLDAYTMLATYLSKTKANERIVLHIFEKHISHLVEEEEAASNDSSPVQPPPDIFAQLARTQALLIYEIIGLFDGSIRGRALAERYIGLLAQWSRQLFDTSKEVLQNSNTQSPSLSSSGHNTPMTQNSETTNPVATWRTWILVESVRRTYLMATLAEAAFTTIKQGWAPCPGGITFTCGRGLWSAKSAKEWLALSKQQQVLYLKCIDGDELLSGASPTAVDEFTHMVIIASFGLERFQQWD